MRTVVLVLLAVQLFISRGSGTPLDDYVNKPDPTYNYEIIDTFQGPGYTLYTINMTSQTWKPDLQSQPIWWHYLSVTVPDKLDLQNAGFLFIDGGSNTNSPPKPTDTFVELTTIVAVTTNSVGANLKMVPNQPIVFKADPTQKRRTEDAIIAWTWKTFVDQKGADPEILLRMPMTKAGVRALDTMNDLTQKKKGTTVDRFLVAGASKRGWTTWTVGAVDKRVVAIAPIVMDLLNMQTNLHHYYRALGGWTFAFDDYYNLNFTQDLDSPYIKQMASIIDPLSYNDRYANKPKLITSTGGDEFFMIDDAKYYFNDLKGPKYLRMVPNAEHSLAGHEIGLLFGIRAFYLSVMRNKPLPEISWNLNTTSTGGKITLMSATTPLTVHCYHATTLDGKRKDFRLLRGTPGDPGKPQIHPVLWGQQYVPQTSSTTWEVEFKNPEVGWTAFFIQVTFQGLEDSVLEFTTQTLIIPNTDPFPDCHGEQCRGTLV
ncbi:autocrine proliferation repressor protein A-like [Mercenaria mercenaria]|uniref:autocrine proliferation repressor protein A-like n=1 Tax=Mercenaria mercenaria TaxID=6596 RepID=UPI00234E3ECC|nr:autocrine proliferation repressor protein A-like [Mercenaria mercenaria]